MKKIISVLHFADGFIARGVNDNGVNGEIPIAEVRGAVTWPTGSLPGYYLLMGQEKGSNKHGKRPLLFLAEKEEKTITSLFDSLTDDMARLKCFTIYANREGNQTLIDGFYGALWDYLHNKRLTPRLFPAPSADDIEYGKVLIQEWLKHDSLDIPRFSPTILRDQLKKMVTEGAVEQFYAFHALRYLLTGFAKYPARIATPFAQNRNADRKDPRGWT
jgi:hypothetical protein